MGESLKRRQARREARKEADKQERKKFLEANAQREAKEALSTLSSDDVRAAVERELWLRGDLSFLLLPGAQRVAYDAVHSWEAGNAEDAGPVVLHLHRGASKTWLLVLLAIERCLRYPGQVVRLGAPSLKQCEDVLEPAFRHFFSKCPADLRPEWEDRSYVFKSPRWEDPNARSRLCVFGCREGADSQRGLRSNMVCLDEVRDIDDCEYVVTSVIGPQFVKQTRPLCVLTSTSPGTTGHPFWTFVDDAQRAGRYVHIGVDDNPDFSPADRRMLTSLCKGTDTPAWRREALCLRVADESLLVMPSFSKNKATIVVDSPQPDAFFTFESLDMGFVDLAHCIFAHINFEKLKLVVEDEVCGSSIGTQELIKAIKDKEKKLWGKSLLWSKTQRIADCTPRERADLAHGGLYFSPARPNNWEQHRTLAMLESLFYQGSVEIHPRCRHLIYQLENATRNASGSDVKRERLPEFADPNAVRMGHADGMFALGYLAEKTRFQMTASPYVAARAHRNSIQGDGASMFSEIDIRPIAITFR